MMQDKDILDQKLPGKWNTLQDRFLHFSVCFGIMLLIWHWGEGKQTLIDAFGQRFYEVSKGLLLISFAGSSGMSTFKFIKLIIRIRQFKIISKDED